ncbi:MAG: pitrilysin family protein [Planctomycetia bacterium]|nr:pitrilysin family protein [Planctomycetia bacterium]
MKFKHKQLDNGLEIIAEINANAYSAAIGFFVRTGSRDETPELAGCSHFLEHLVFKGTATRTAVAVNRELDDMGGRANAFTGEEVTAYYIILLPELLEHGIELLADLMRPALRQEDFEMERKVVLEEIQMYDDQPPYGIDEKSRELFFAGHPVGKSVLGTAESISAVTVDQIRDYHQRQYSPGNIVVTACGNVDFELLVHTLARVCGTWKACDVEHKLTNPQVQCGQQVIVRPTSNQEYICRVSLAPSRQDDDRYAAAVLANMLGDDVGSRLFWELVDNGRADSASLSYANYADTGSMVTWLCGAPEDTQENLGIIDRIVRDVSTNGFREEEFLRARNKILSAIVLAGETPRGRLFGVGAEWLHLRRYYTIADDVQIVNSLSLDQIHAVLAKYPLTESLTMAVGPLETL